MTESERVDRLEAQVLAAVAEQTELLNRMMTLIEGHVARLERLEYHVLGIQPVPAMRTARHDH
jgi:hypothetical protein